jgi:hypothetical protein
MIPHEHSQTCRCLMLLLLLATLAGLPALQAAPRSQAEVARAVETWVRFVTADARTDAAVEAIELHMVGGEVVGYIVHLRGGGFCLAGADDLVLPVYLYSPHGEYDPGSAELQYFLGEIAGRVTGLRAAQARSDVLIENYRAALAERAAFWGGLVAGRAAPRKGLMMERADPDSMSLPLTSCWHQGAPFNDQCPLLTPPDENAIVGCVATAAAQIMRYWAWPATGEGSASVDYSYRWRSDWDEEPMPWCPVIPSKFTGRLEWTAAGGGRLRMNGYWDQTVYDQAYDLDPDSQWHDAVAALYGRLTPATDSYDADFSAATYDWSVMRDAYLRPTDPGHEEVAEICAHAGIGMGMHYGLWSSGAYLSHPMEPDMVDALEDHFRYDSDATWDLRDIERLTEEIQYLRPAVLAGDKPDSAGGGGHAWVILGYNKATDPDRQFLMQIGWGPPAVWYSCDAIPWNEDQEEVTRIAPGGAARFVSGSGSGDGTPADPYGTVEEAVTEAPDDAVIIFKAGGEYLFTATPLVIARPLTLKGRDVTLRKGS